MKKTPKRILAAVCTAAVAASLLCLPAGAAAPADCPKDATCPVSKFKDTTVTAWYHDGVHYVLDEGIMTGVGDDRFAPGDPTTRGMIVTMLYRLEGEPMIRSGIPFSDVKEDAWYAMAVSWSESQGIVSGYGDGRFGPNDNVTREQLAAILYRYAQTKGQGFTGAWAFPLDYPDAAQVSQYAYEPMCWMTMTKVIQGNEQGNLVPKANATRAEVATMLMRFEDVLAANAPADPDKVNPDDFVGNWLNDRAELTITATEDGYQCEIYWGNTAMTGTTYSYPAQFDGTSLVCEGKGERHEVAYNEDASIASDEVVYTDGSASFTLNEDGTLTWTDFKEYPGESGQDGVSVLERREPTDDTVDPADFTGAWVSGRAYMTIAPDGENYKCLIQWGGSYDSASTWKYISVFDGTNLTCDGTGQRHDVTFAEDGSIASDKEIYTDGSAAFTLNGDGTLTWIDYKEYTGEGDAGVTTFQSAEFSPAPTQEELQEGYFDLIKGDDQTDFNLAAVVYDAIVFARDHSIATCNVKTLRANLLADWEGMSKADQEAFDAHFLEVCKCVLACQADWAKAKDAFVSTGNVEEMEAILKDEAAMLSWDSLAANTLTMGNEEF